MRQAEAPCTEELPQAQLKWMAMAEDEIALIESLPVVRSVQLIYNQHSTNANKAKATVRAAGTSRARASNSSLCPATRRLRRRTSRRCRSCAGSYMRSTSARAMHATRRLLQGWHDWRRRRSPLAKQVQLI
jgi:hypothetical protein